MRFLTISASVTLVFGSIAAQTGSSAAPVIDQVRALPAYQKSAEASFLRFEQSLSTKCTDVSVNWPHAQKRIVTPPQLSPDGALYNVTWDESVPGIACGERRDYRVLVQYTNGKNAMYPLLPGDGWAGPLLQRDTLTQVNAASVIYTQKRCAVDVVNTHLSAGDPVHRRKEPWEETWTVHSCGKQFLVPITFLPDNVGDGTSMSVSPKKIRPVP